jgi:hypothetical protein
MKDPLIIKLAAYSTKRVIEEDTYRDRILVVCSRENLLHDQPPCASDNGRVIPEICVLEQDTVVFLMDTNCILDFSNASRLCRKVGIKVVNCSLAITAQGQAVCQITGTILAKVKGMLSLMRVFRVSTVQCVSSMVSLATWLTY